MSTLLFCPTKTGITNLQNEGFSLELNTKASIDRPNVYLCGDIMFDNSLYFSSISIEKSKILNDLRLNGNDFILCTIHRDSNTDYSENINSIFKALVEIQESSELNLVLPIHPRTKGKMSELLDQELLRKIEENQKIQIIPPAGFLDIITLEKNARIIVTDSGGLQKEAFFFQKPCVILREQTEWVEIVENGNAILTGSNKDKIVSAYNELIKKSNYSFPSFYGNGQAAEFICSKILDDLG
jgi:UDP-GlcNAc3NAcA epimerase